MVRRLRQQIQYAPSCGIGSSQVPVGVVEKVTCTYVTVDKLTPAEGEVVTATAKLVYREGLIQVPLANKTLYYRVLKNGVEIPGSEGTGTTDANGEITFTHTVDGPGVYTFQAEFRGDPESEYKGLVPWVGCPYPAICVTAPPPPGGIEPGRGGIVLPPPTGPAWPEVGPGILTQPSCGILCGQGLNQNIKGLEPE